MADPCPRRTNQGLFDLHLLFRHPQFRPRQFQLGLIGARVDLVQQFPRADPLVIDDVQLHDPAVHPLQHHVDEVRPHHGIIGGGMTLGLLIDPDPGHHGAADDGNAQQAADEQAPLWQHIRPPFQTPKHSNQVPKVRSAHRLG